MAERTTVARPYANAAFASAKKHDLLVVWSTGLAVGASVVADSRVKPLLGSPQVKLGAIAGMIGDIAGDSGVPMDGGMSNFLLLLEDGGRIELLPEIAELYDQLYQAQQNQVDVTIDAALEIGDAQRQLIEKSLARRLSKEVSVTINIDESLLGGAVIRVADQVIDGSVRGRLQQLAATLQQ